MIASSPAGSVNVARVSGPVSCPSTAASATPATGTAALAVNDATSIRNPVGPPPASVTSKSRVFTPGTNPLVIVNGPTNPS